MATTLAQVARYLEQKDITHTVDEENRNVWVGCQTENIECFQIGINVSEEGEYLQFAVGVLGDVTERQAPIIHKALLHISLETNMVRWAYEPLARKVWATVDLLLMDNPLTEQVFYAHLEALVTIVDSIAIPRLSGILNTGVDPYSNSVTTAWGTPSPINMLGQEKSSRVYGYGKFGRMRLVLL